VGHAAENLFLQAQDLDLATADIGAFDDQEVARVLRLPGDVAPLLLMPVGVPR
jgi:nitroreductase